MHCQLPEPLKQFIERELHVEPRAIALAERNIQFPSQISVSLWQYGLISLEGVNRIWSWLDARSDLDPLSTATSA